MSMNKTRRLFVNSKLAVLILIMPVFLLVSSRYPALGFKLFDQSEAVVELKVKAAKNLFDYKGTTLGEPVKASIFFTDKEGGKGHYEDLWFTGATAIGLNRFSELSVPSGSSVAIAIGFEDAGSAAQVQAAANASLRILLDLYVAGHSVSRLEVADDDTARALISSLGQTGFVESAAVLPDEMVESSLSLSVKSRSSSRLYSLNYGVTQ
ncbi:MAG: hypothetical protein HY986_03300 [Candidatus Melainabacteria bacterium]|nr:hypothetical protein [Candidatus Melainabacteria bacterium]